MIYETVIGLEVHTELSTASKIFCGCTTRFGGEPNTHVCEVCSGMPGTLPVLNRRVLEYAIRAGWRPTAPSTAISNLTVKTTFIRICPRHTRYLNFICRYAPTDTLKSTLPKAA